MGARAVELREVVLPLRRPFRTAAGTTTERRLVLVHLLAEDQEGWAECAALGEPSYTAEDVDSAWDVLRRHLVPRLLGAEREAGVQVGAEGVAAVLAPVKGHPMAKAALEAAVLDAELRHEGRSLAERLGGVRSAVDSGAAVGIAPLPELLDEVGRLLEAGHRRVKLKVRPGFDVEPVRAVRERFGDVPLQVDANGAYAGHGWEPLAALDPFGLLLLEQPLDDDDLLGHAELAARVRTPVCLDESITSARAAAVALRLGACSVVNLKPGRVGGLLEAVRVHDVCVAAGAGLWVGGMVSSGLGRAADVALAALPGCTLPGDLSASSRWFDEDLTEPWDLVDGQLVVPTGPGLGVTPRLDVLRAATRRVEVLRPG